MSRAMEAASSVEKAMDVLLHLHDAREACGVTAIGRALGLPKSSTHRLLSSLGRRGLVERDARGRYRPGFALVALGLGVLESDPLVAAAGPVLESRAAALGETFFLVTARAGRLVVLDKAEGSGFLRAAPRIGSEVPVHATAVGKLYGAFQPDLVGPVAAVAEAFTPRTRTRADELAAEVARARERGFATNRDEWVAGLSVVAAPIRRRRDAALAGAVALAAASPRLDEIGEEAAARQVLEAAGAVAARLDAGPTEGGAGG